MACERRSCMHAHTPGHDPLCAGVARPGSGAKIPVAAALFSGPARARPDQEAVPWAAWSARGQQAGGRRSEASVRLLCGATQRCAVSLAGLTTVSMRTVGVRGASCTRASACVLRGMKLMEVCGGGFQPAKRGSVVVRVGG
jgi:hypothetical protein